MVMGSSRLPSRVGAVGPLECPSGRRGDLPGGNVMASKNLYVGNLSFTTTEQDLAQLFGQYGPVTKTQLIMDRETGRSRGFGFVEMSSGTDEAIQALNNAEYQGRRLTVNEAKPREERPRGGGGGYGGGGPRGGGGGGGYGGGGGGYGGGGGGDRY